MTTIAETLAKAMQSHQAGAFQHAEALFRQILLIDPAHPEALHFLGAIAHHAGKHDLAVDYMEQSIALVPLHAGFHGNLGVVYQALGRFDAAGACYRKALQLRPDFTDAQLRLGDLMQIQGRVQEAITCYRQVLRLLPNCSQAHNNLGNALCAQGLWQQAAASLLQAQRLLPDSADVCFNLGHALAAQKNLDAAAACYRQALRLRPDMAEAHAALGWVLGDLGMPEEAIACLEEALRRKPSDRLRVALATRLPVIYQSQSELQAWRDRVTAQVRNLHEQAVVLDLTDQTALNVFYLVYQGLDDLDLPRQIAKLYRAPAQPTVPIAEVAGPLGGTLASSATPNGPVAEVARLPGGTPATSATPNLPVAEVARLPGGTGKKIRVGILSSLLKAHTIGFWLQGLVAQLSRDDFTVTVLSIGKQDDEVARFIQQHADHYLEVPGHVQSARRLIAQQQLDILLYPDIGMDPVTYTLAFSRLAPVQCVTIGHPVTTGIGTIDYFLSTQDLETDQSEQHYSEALIRLKTLPIYFYRPQLPSPLKNREQFGLAEGDHLYACLQYLFKIHPQFDELLGGILRGDPRGTVLLSSGLVPHWEQLLRQRFAATLPDVANRIRFLPLLSYPDYLNVLALADVLLDPHPFGGGSTSYEGLAVGTPIVTLPSGLLRGRITFALYRQMQLLDCVAHTPQEYIDIALRLGTDRGYCDAMRQKILEANGVLFENSAGIRELEEFFRWAAMGEKCNSTTPFSKPES